MLVLAARRARQIMAEPRDARESQNFKATRIAVKSSRRLGEYDFLEPDFYR